MRRDWLQEKYQHENAMVTWIDQGGGEKAAVPPGYPEATRDPGSVIGRQLLLVHD